MSTERDFARGMRSLRLASRMSQSDLAREIAASQGVTLDPSAIARMENTQGHATPRVIRLNEAIAIAELFGCRVEQVCDMGDTRRAESLANALRRLADEIGGAS